MNGSFSGVGFHFNVSIFPDFSDQFIQLLSSLLVLLINKGRWFEFIDIYHTMPYICNHHISHIRTRSFGFGGEVLPRDGNVSIEDVVYSFSVGGTENSNVLRKCESYDVALT